MKIEELRNKNLPEVCEMLGLVRDPADKKQWRGENCRVTLNGFAWFDHESGRGSGGAIDLIMHVLGIGFNQALEFAGAAGDRLPERKPEPVKSYLSPPMRVNSNIPAIVDYLKTRALEPVIIEWLINNQMLYADKYSNCVFMYGAAACELRGTGAVQWRSSRGQFTRGFIIPAANCAGVAVLESAIDAISYRQLHKNHFAVSIGGNSNDAIMQSVIELAKTKQVPIIAAFDNDKGGEIPTERLKALAIVNNVEFGLNRPTNFKDWNDQLKAGL